MKDLAQKQHTGKKSYLCCSHLGQLLSCPRTQNIFAILKLYLEIIAKQIMYNCKQKSLAFQGIGMFM